MQPFVHAGAYSEGEFAISPSIVRLAAERKLPMGGDWDTTILGQDQGKDPCVEFMDEGLCAMYRVQLPP